MNPQSFPCKECISYAICKNKLYTECSILFDSLDHTYNPDNNHHMKIISRKNRDIAQKYAKALGFDRFIFYAGRIFMFKSLGLTIQQEKEVIAFLERNQLHGVF